MNVRLILPFVVCLGTASPAAVPNSPEIDRDKLLGQWTAMSGETSGGAFKPDDLKNTSLNADSELWLYGKANIKGGQFALNPGQKPKTIDVTAWNGVAEGPTVLGIYELDGDTLRLCWAESGKPRPAEFAASGKDGVTLMTFHRVVKKLPADVVDILAKAEQLELYSLDPDDDLEKPPPDAFHRHRVLGKTVVSDEAVRKHVIAGLEKGVAQGTRPAKCFWPRHGVRVTHNGKTLDLVICFQCSQLSFILGDKAETVVISKSPESVLDKTLKDAGVPLAPKAAK